LSRSGERPNSASRLIRPFAKSSRRYLGSITRKLTAAGSIRDLGLLTSASLRSRAACLIVSHPSSAVTGPIDSSALRPVSRLVE
jgi:hypothetical protein